MKKKIICIILVISLILPYFLVNVYSAGTGLYDSISFPESQAYALGKNLAGTNILNGSKPNFYLISNNKAYYSKQSFTVELTHYLTYRLRATNDSPIAVYVYYNNDWHIASSGTSGWFDIDKPDPYYTNQASIYDYGEWLSGTIVMTANGQYPTSYSEFWASKDKQDQQINAAVQSNEIALQARADSLSWQSLFIARITPADNLFILKHIPYISDIYNILVNVATNIGSSINDFLSPLLSNIKSAVDSVGSSVSGFLKPVLDNTYTTLIGLATSIWSKFSSSLGTISSTLSNLSNNIFSRFQGVLDYIPGLFAFFDIEQDAFIFKNFFTTVSNIFSYINPFDENFFLKGFLDKINPLHPDFFLKDLFTWIGGVFNRLNPLSDDFFLKGFINSMGQFFQFMGLLFIPKEELDLNYSSSSVQQRTFNKNYNSSSSSMSSSDSSNSSSSDSTTTRGQVYGFINKLKERGY